MTANLKQLFLFLFIFCSFLAISLELLANEKEDKINYEYKKIKFLIIDSETSIYKINHPDEYVLELAHAFKNASIKYNIDVNLLIAIGYRESIFKMSEKGDNNKSLGIMQVGKQGRKACKCDMSSVDGQIDCGACWLDKGRSWCGDIRGGVSAYACGKCEPVNSLSKQAINIKFRLVEMLENFMKELSNE